MKFRIRKRSGKWKLYAVYFPNEDREYEVWIDSYVKLSLAYEVAIYLSKAVIVNG